MEVGSLHDRCIWSPIRSSSPHRPLVVHSMVVSISARKKNLGSLRRRSSCPASSSETLVAGSRKEEFADLKSWMHKNGLPPCKVVLKERPSHDEKHRPIHYVAASEDLQVKREMWNSLWFFTSLIVLQFLMGNWLLVSCLEGWGCCVLSAEFPGRNAWESLGERDRW